VKIIKLITVMAAAALCSRAETLDSILARMDAASKTFKSVSASIKKTEYTAVIKDSISEEGLLKIKRDKKSIAAITEYTGADTHTELIKAKEAWVYHPKAKIAQVYSLAKWMSTVDQFVLLAFGTSGDDLKKNYEIKLGGAEKIGSIATTRLELDPKSADVKKLFTKFELWIPDGQSNAIREKVTAPSGDYYLIEYSNVKFEAVPDSAFDLKLPKDVKIVYPQK
jgi:outer membrane lipoprotein-sorting protein